jgi:squalene synthase HpnC/squalene synthase HpnD
MQPPHELEIARELPPAGCSPAEAERYTRWLATHHYENFNVVSWLLPRGLHQYFYNVYAYCRWADDLGDEVADPGRALELLAWWEQELHACYAGRPSHPVFVALAPTVRELDIPVEPFAELLAAFRQDQTVHRYATWEDVLGYCRYSANPVGRLVLYVCGYRDAERQQLSDATCTALQLANFWQDVARDLEKGRIYIPQDRLEAHGLTFADIEAKRFDTRYVALMRDLIARTRELFAAGLPLAQRVDPALRVDIEMFSRGGLAVLDAIETTGYNTLAHRPALSRATQVRLLGRALLSRLFAFGAFSGDRALSHARMAQESSRKPPASPRGDRESAAGVPEPESAQVAASYAECRRIARTAASNFYYAFFLLPRPKRDALCTLYAFMRLVDDVSDSAGDPAAKQRALAAWRAHLDAAVAGDTGGHAILPAFADTIARYAIPPRYFHDLISGAEMDLTEVSYATFDRLSEYCYRVAGTVGLTCLYVFGFRDPRAPDLAEKLGIAFQLTNILRDVPRDFEMGRVYLPQEDLQHFGCHAEDLAGESPAPGLAQLFEFEAGRAWRFYEEGAALVSLIDRDSRGALWALVRIYSGLLRRIEARGYDVFSSRVRLTAAEKARILLRARLGGWSETHVLEERDRGRRRTGGDVLGRRAG